MKKKAAMIWDIKERGLLGASVRNSAHGRGHEEGGFGIRKGGIKPQETPCCQSSTPKTRVLLYCFMLSPIPLTLREADHPRPPLPPSSLGEGANLQLQLIKIPGRDKGVPGQTSLLAD